MSKRRIVHIVPTFSQGGVQTGILYSLKDLNEVYDYKVLVLTSIDEDWIKDLPPAQKNQIISTGATSIAGSWRKGYSILKQLQPDFIISSMWKSSGLSAAYKLFNKKTGLAGFFHTSYTPHLPYRISMQLLSYLQDITLTDSQVSKNYTTKVYKTKNTHVIPYLFPFNKTAVLRTPDPQKIKLAYFGIISPVKRVDRALEFCRLCKQQSIGFIFDIYAHGDVEAYREKIAAMDLSDNVSIRQTLPLHEVMEHMQQYDFLLQLSDHEGMALSVVEAMNAGIVPIVTPVGEIARYSSDGINAIWLNRPFDEELPVLVEKFKRLYADPAAYHKLATAAASTFHQYKNYSEALLEVLNNFFNSASKRSS